MPWPARGGQASRGSLRRRPQLLPPPPPRRRPPKAPLRRVPSEPPGRPRGAARGGGGGGGGSPAGWGSERSGGAHLHDDVDVLLAPLALHTRTSGENHVASHVVALSPSLHPPAPMLQEAAACIARGVEWSAAGWRCRRTLLRAATNEGSEMNRIRQEMSQHRNTPQSAARGMLRPLLGRARSRSRRQSHTPESCR